MPDDFPTTSSSATARRTRRWCAPLAERLRQDGLKVWFDEWVLKPGDSIPAKIEEGLEHSRVLVLCMSANAFGSDWAQLEAGTFRFRDPLNQERRFIPLRLDDAPIKGSLAQFLYINWRPADREQEYAKLLEACRRQRSRRWRKQQTAGEQAAEKTIQLDCKTMRSRCLRVQSGWKHVSHRLRLTGPCGCGTWRRGACLRVFEGHTEASLRAWPGAPINDRVLSGSMTIPCGCGMWRRGAACVCSKGHIGECL